MRSRPSVVPFFRFSVFPSPESPPISIGRTGAASRWAAEAGRTATRSTRPDRTGGGTRSKTAPRITSAGLEATADAETVPLALA